MAEAYSFGLTPGPVRDVLCGSATVHVRLVSPFIILCRCRGVCVKHLTDSEFARSERRYNNRGITGAAAPES